MRYHVVIPRTVQKQLDNLPGQVIDRILDKLISLENEPRPFGSIKLRGYENEYRIRVGDYRIRYEIKDSEFVVIVLHCKHRKDVYR
jgi:mRNA interferase RelE/StbE